MLKTGLALIWGLYVGSMVYRSFTVYHSILKQALVIDACSAAFLGAIFLALYKIAK